jgi:hypothetical protein
MAASRWLEHYATLFDTVEINTTFYRLPSVTAVDGWVEHTPPDFVFAVKASRFLTHMRRLSDMDRGVRRFYERIEPLVHSSKLGPRALAAAAELPPQRRPARGGARRSPAGAATPSSSATRPGSLPTSSSCSASTGWRW